MKKRVHAFTLFEMMVALILTAIVVSIAYLCINIISNQINGFKSKNKQVMESSGFDSVFKNDFEKALTAASHTNGLHFYFPAGRKITYNFNSNFILRTVDEVRDTFFVAAVEMEKKFMNLKQENTNGLVDEVIFHSKITGEPEQFHYKKRYASADLMEAENKNEEQ
ncbi:MAG: prepilin-type N-terminal cleavage/methylation domain-containing protein [Bacteroidia bacterium]